MRSKQNDGPLQRSIFAGWTGFESKPRKPTIVGRDGGRGSKEETATVEISTAFGRTLGLKDGEKVSKRGRDPSCSALIAGDKVGISLHVDPSLAHTINIEPLTPSDWESKFSCLS